MSQALEVKTDKQMTALRQIATQSTPKNEIRTRQGRGGAQLKYTDGPYVIRTLNNAFGWDWDFVADSEELLTNNGKPFEVKVRGTLTVRLNGQAVTKTQYGCQPIEFLRNGEAPVSIGDAYKGAATDAMKKCASLLGIALDLYDSDYRADKYAESEPEPERQREPEPVRNVKLEGAQPTRAQATSKNGKQIMALINGLHWDDDKVRAWVEDKFNYLIETDDFAGFFDVMSNTDQQAVIIALKGAFGRG
jgi:hypothetical protein